MTAESRFCKNCKQDVSADNFSLHEVHCLRFLTLCPECDEPVAQKDMKDHQTEAHKEVKCNLCHQSLQQYQLEHHEEQLYKMTVKETAKMMAHKRLGRGCEMKECLKRPTKCQVCEVEMPFNKLQEHLNTCASQTERCWECNKYITYKDLSKHKGICQNRALPYPKDGNFPTSEASTNATSICPTGTGGNLCQKCCKLFPDDQYSQHLEKCSADHKLTKDPAGQSTSKLSSFPPESPSSLATSSCSQNAMVWKDVRPKVKERDQPLTSKTFLKPPKNKKIGIPSPTGGGLSKSPHALGETQSFDMLVTCAHCNIILPLPTLQKHEIKCHRLTSLKNARMKEKASHGEEEDSCYGTRD